MRYYRQTWLHLSCRARLITLYFILLWIVSLLLSIVGAIKSNFFLLYFTGGLLICDSIALVKVLTDIKKMRG